MDKKIFVVLGLFVMLIGVVIFEQIYTENAVDMMLKNVEVLERNIADKDIIASIEVAEDIDKLWAEKESVICLFVDYRDIAEIGKQTNLINSHLKNEDFELAKVECNYLKKALITFKNMINFDIQSII